MNLSPKGISNLSNGQKMLMGLLTAIDTGADLLIDEALSTFSEKLRQDVITLVTDYAKLHKKFVIIIDHNHKQEHEFKIDKDKFSQIIPDISNRDQSKLKEKDIDVENAKFSVKIQKKSSSDNFLTKDGKIVISTNKSRD